MKGLMWTGYLEEPNFQDAVRLLNELKWHLSWREVKSQWWVWSGDQLLFVGDSLSEMEAFICGMAFTYASLPGDILQQIKNIIRE